MKTDTLIPLMDTCINRLNTVKQVLKDEGKEIEKNDLLLLAANHFVNKIYEHVIHYSQPFIKNNGNNQNGKM